MLLKGGAAPTDVAADLQAIDEKGYQQELPDIWLSNGNPWEIPRPDITFKIGFYGSVDNFKWSPGETVSGSLIYDLLAAAHTKFECMGSSK